MLLIFLACLVDRRTCQGGRHGQTTALRCFMEADRTVVATGATQTQGRTATDSRSCLSDRHSLRAQDGLSVGVSSTRVGLWQRDDLLAKASRLAQRRSLEENLARALERTGAGRRHRLVDLGHRQLFGTSCFGGAKTGPNPTDRGKIGSKRHLMTDGNGTPLAIAHTGANCHDSQMAIALVDDVPAIKQPRGRPRRRPDEVLADRAYDAEEKIRKPLRKRGIKPVVPHRNTEHGSGLGKHRYVVEACFDWLFNWRRLRLRYEKRPDIHDAFLIIGCIMICSNRVEQFC